MNSERELETLSDEPKIDVLDYGDAIAETRQTAPIPRVNDSQFGFGFHKG